MIEDRNNLVRGVGQQPGQLDLVKFQPRKSVCVGRTPDGQITDHHDSSASSDATTKGVKHAARIRGPVPDLEEYYPAQSKRDEEEGVVVITMEVDGAGCPTSFAVTGSSGSDTLDKGALEFSELLSYYPATLDGQPVASVITQPITFKLKN